MHTTDTLKKRTLKGEGKEKEKISHKTHFYKVDDKSYKRKQR